MKRSRFTEEQIIGVLKEHEAGVPVADLCRRHGVGNASLYSWKSKYGGMDVSEARRLKALEDVNARLKKLLADAMLDNSALKDILGENGDARCRARCRRPSPDCVWDEGRRACRALNCCRMTMRYRALRTDDVALRERMRAIAHERRRFGYRRLHVLLKREGHVINHKRLFRI